MVLEEDPKITDQFPLKCLARVTVTLEDGRVLESGTLSAKGDPDNPYSEAAMYEKFMALAASLTQEKGEWVYRHLKDIEHYSVTDIWDAMR